MKMHASSHSTPLATTTIFTPGVSIFAKDKVKKKREGLNQL